MFIQTEDTPNPLSLKFLPGRVVLPEGTYHFSDLAEAALSPLAQKLFMIANVDAVFLGADFISVTKTEDSDWSLVKPQVLAGILDHFMSGQPIILDQAPSVDRNPTNDPIIAQIIELIDTRIRPAVAADGGDIIFDRFEEGVVFLRLHGACSGCPSSSATLKSGIENLLRHYVPEVEEVRAV